MKIAASLLLYAVALSAVEPSPSSSAEAIFNRAAAALAAGDFVAAENGFQTVLRQEPHQVATLSNLGVVYSRTNHPDKAIQVYRRALQISPDDKAILVNLGLVYLKQENHAKALPLFARVVAIDPGHLQARQLLAVCQVYAGQLAPAIDELEALNSAHPGDDNILFLLGFAYLKSHDAERAKATFQSMFDAAGPTRAAFLIGKANYEATLFPQAEESFLNVLRDDPGFPGIHLELGKVYISLRQNERAVAELHAALKANPNDVDAAYFLGGLLVQDGRFAEGIPYLERVKAARPDSWAAFFYLGKAEAHLNKPAEAAALLQRSVELNPDEPTAWYQLGQVLRASGHETQAREALAKVRALKAAALQATSLDDGRVAGAR